MFVVEPIKPYSQTLLCQALKKHEPKQANLSSESEHVQSGQPSHMQEGERLQADERRKAAIAHNYFPVLCAHKKNPKKPHIRKYVWNSTGSSGNPAKNLKLIFSIFSAPIFSALYSLHLPSLSRRIPITASSSGIINQGRQ